MQKRIKILGVPFDTATLSEVIEWIEKKILENGQIHIATPNPEIVLEAQKNPVLKKILEKTHLNIPDGIGIILASKGKIKSRVTGTDVMEKILIKSSEPHSPLFQKKIFLLGAVENVAEKVQKKFTEQLKEIKITGTESGSPMAIDEERLIKKINESGAEILFVAYGAPAQEIWIEKNLPKLNIKFAMGVGGAFDFFAEIKKRAPKWMQKYGLEWLYRLIQEPKRAKRIYNAVIKFPILVLRDAFWNE